MTMSVNQTPGQDLIIKLQQTNTNFCNNNFTDYLSKSQKNSMVCDLVDDYELEKIITRLNCSESAGYDNITSNITTITLYI